MTDRRDGGTRKAMYVYPSPEAHGNRYDRTAARKSLRQARNAVAKKARVKRTLRTSVRRTDGANGGDS